MVRLYAGGVHFGKQQLGLVLAVGADATAANVPVFAGWRQRLPVEPREAFNRVIGSQGELAGLAIFQWKADPPASEFQWIPGPSDDLVVKMTWTKTTGRDTSMKLDVKPIQGIPVTSSTISGILAYHTSGGQPGGVAVTLDRKTMQCVSPMPDWPPAAAAP